jgi:hypothetical protein
MKVSISFIFLLINLNIAGNTQVSQWSIFENSYKAKPQGNPFQDISFIAEFRHEGTSITVDGFYDGDNSFKIRFMPTLQGNWTFVTRSNLKALDNKTGSFTCTPAETGIHGPVYVRDTFDFGYADGTPFYPVGTTCYQWVFQGNSEQTLVTLAKNAFNKIRMCVFPKNYDVYINNEPVMYPFEGSKEKGWDFERYNPAYFQFFEDKVEKLMKLGIEADIILFHPYDWGKWGFDKMPQDKREKYLKYLISRIAAYRNVWWSLANEFEYLGIPDSDWEKLFNLIRDKDPYHHLRSIHNGEHWYDVSKPYISHLSVQTTDFFEIQDWRQEYKKPVVIDECVYEGDIPADWGNLTPEEMTSRFWQVYCRGGYCTHGETYIDSRNILWWSKGGILKGKSPARIAFLRKIMEERPVSGVVPFHNLWNKEMYLFKPGEYYLYYYGNTQQKLARFQLPGNIKFKFEVIDTWNMTITPVEGTFIGSAEIKMPGRPWMAVRIKSEMTPE